MSIHRKASKTTLIKLPKIPQKTKSSERNMRASIKIDSNPDPITALTYGVYDSQLHSLIQYNKSAKREIASLTKMMTLFCSIKLAKKFKIDISKCYFRVTINAAGTRGTSAELQSRQWITIEDLLYGLMLPSGNDAATVLAQNFGACIYYDRLGESSLLLGTWLFIKDLKSLDLTEDTFNAKLYVEQFVKIMNQTGKEIGMKETNYINPHGLDSNFKLQAYSILEDQLLLAKNILQNEECMKFMRKNEHVGSLKTINGKEVEVRKITWVNTNSLLRQSGFIGGKTGQTQFAGNCLISIYESPQKQKYLIAVFGCSSKQHRFSQTKFLVDKYIKNKAK